MTRARPLLTYHHQQYMALVNKVLNENTAFLAPCTATQAASLRGELYAWRRACELAPSEARALGVEPEKLRLIGWRIKPGGLETCLAADFDGPRIIEQALGGNLPDLASPAAQALAALQANLGKEPSNGG